MKTIEVLTQKLENHKIYSNIRSIHDLRVFMKYHVFAVWDFMCLLKTLQTQLTCTTSPWIPVENSTSARLINEIVLSEETDFINGQATSHFELYVDAMMDIGADSHAVNSFIMTYKMTNSLEKACEKLPYTVKPFVENTLLQCKQQPHQVAAAFLYGRESVIPQMFQRILKANVRDLKNTRSFVTYLERHIELDGDSHGPMAEKLLAELCGPHEVKWYEAKEAAEEAIYARIKLWDDVERDIELNRIPTNKHPSPEQMM